MAGQWTMSAQIQVLSTQLFGCRTFCPIVCKPKEEFNSKLSSGLKYRCINFSCIELETACTIKM